MYGLAIGAEPMVALQSIHVVDGRPQPSAELMRAMILRDGHSITVHQATGEVCRVSGLRRGEPEQQRVRVEWSLDMARKAGLLTRQNWQRYPRAMLLARATSELARIAFPDAIKGLGQISEDSPDELEAWAGTQVDSEPAPTKARAVRRKAHPEIGRTVTDVPLPEVVPDGEPEPGQPPWPTPLDPWADDAGGTPHVPQDPPAEPDSTPTPAPIGDSLRRSLMAASSRLGIDPTRDRAMRLALWSALLGRQIESSNNLARGEALTLLRRMNDCETGAVEWDFSVETGAVTLRRLEGEPPNDDQ